MIVYLIILLLALLAIRFPDTSGYDEWKWKEIDRLNAWWALR